VAVPSRAEGRGRPRERGELLAVLKVLALDGADHSAVLLSSREVGERVGVSQQAADRYLVLAEKRGYLSRALAQRRQRLQLTPEGMRLLRLEYHGYRRIFEGPERATFHGEVASGLGEGRYYLSQPGYVVQFTERLGYTPFPGTLNVKLKPAEARRLGIVGEWNGVRIDGFQASGRTFGGATCFPARINGSRCHLIRPDRTHHTDVAEFVAAECLRKLLDLKDGTAVKVTLEES
jgi:riboflavin kinase